MGRKILEELKEIKNLLLKIKENQEKQKQILITHPDITTSEILESQKEIEQFVEKFIQS